MAKTVSLWYGHEYSKSAFIQMTVNFELIVLPCLLLMVHSKIKNAKSSVG